MVEINDRLHTLLKLEANQYRTCDYLQTGLQDSFVVNGGETTATGAVVVVEGDDDLMDTSCATSSGHSTSCSVSSGS